METLNQAMKSTSVPVPNGRASRRIGAYRAEDLRLLSRRNRLWRSTVVVLAFGGFVPPDPELLRDHLYALAATGQGGDALRLLEPLTGVTGRPIADDLRAFCDALVEADPAPVAQDLHGHVTRIRQVDLGGLPFRLTLGPDWAGLVINHAIGDGKNILPLLADLTACAGFDNVRGFPVGTRAPLARALTRTYVLSPRTAVAVVRQPRTPWPVQVSGGRTTSAQRDAVVVGCRSSVDFLPELRSLRDATAPSASIFAMLIARTFSFARERDMAMYPGFSVTVDARRYLPAKTQVAGNFSAGNFLGCSAVPTPGEVTETLGTLLRTGRPLLSMLLSARRANVNVKTWVIDPDARTLISFSHLGRLALPAMPAAAQSQLEFATMGRPSGPHGISLNLGEVGGRLNVSASFYPDMLSSDLVRDLTCALTRSASDFRW